MFPSDAADEKEIPGGMERSSREAAPGVCVHNKRQCSGVISGTQEFAGIYKAAGERPGAVYSAPKA